MIGRPVTPNDENDHQSPSTESRTKAAVDPRLDNAAYGFTPAWISASAQI
jgi:hypothetical protein